MHHAGLSLTEAIAALDQLFQALGKAGSRSAIEQIVIEAQCYTEVFTDSNVSINDPRLLSNPAQGEIKRVVVNGNAPARAFAKHPHRRNPDGPAIPLLHRGRPALYPPEQRPEGSKGHQWQPAKVLESPPGLLHGIHLGRPDFMMNLVKGLPVCRPDDIDNGLLLPAHLTLNRGCHVHVIKHGQALTPLAARLHRFVLIDCFCHAGNDECRERQRLSRSRFVLLQKLVSSGHINLDQAVDHGFAPGLVQCNRLRAAQFWIGHHLVISMLLVRHSPASFHPGTPQRACTSCCPHGGSSATSIAPSTSSAPIMLIVGQAVNHGTIVMTEIAAASTVTVGHQTCPDTSPSAPAMKPMSATRASSPKT